MSVTFALQNSGWGDITIQPEWTIRESATKIFNLNRTQTGTHNIYTYSTFKEWRIPLKFISGYYAYHINLLHQLHRPFQLQVVEGGTTQTYSVMMTNKGSPLFQVLRPDATYWQGELLLSEY